MRVRFLNSPRRTAFINELEGENASVSLGAPAGYQPSLKYWAMRATDPATRGVAMLVPLSRAIWQLLAPLCLRMQVGQNVHNISNC